MVHCLGRHDMAAREHSSEWTQVAEGGNPFGDAGGVAWPWLGGGAGGAAGPHHPLPPHAAVEEDMFGLWAAEQGEGSRSCKVESGSVDRMVPVAVAKVSDLADQQSPVVRMPRHSVEGGVGLSRGSSTGNRGRDSAGGVVPPSLPPSLDRSVSSTGGTQRAVAPAAPPTHHHSASQGAQWGRVVGGSAPVTLARSQSLPVTAPSTAGPPPPTNGALPAPAVPVPAAVVAPFLPAGPYAASIWSFTVHAPSAVVREALLATMRCDNVVIMENAWQVRCCGVVFVFPL